MYSGRKLKQLRQSLELTQEDFSKKLGVSQSYYSAIEVSKRKMTKKMKDKILKTWNLQPDYFEGNEIEKKEINKNKILRGKNEGEYGEGKELGTIQDVIIEAYREEKKINEEHPELIEIQAFIDSFEIELSDLIEKLKESKVNKASRFQIFEDYKNTRLPEAEEIIRKYGKTKREILLQLADYKEEIKEFKSAIEKINDMFLKIELDLPKHAHIIKSKQ